MQRERTFQEAALRGGVDEQRRRTNTLSSNEKTYFKEKFIL